MKSKFLVLLTITLVVLAAALPVLAEDGTITLTGGTLQITPQDISCEGKTLNGTQITSGCTVASAWIAEDSRGTGAGWHVTVAASDFESVAEKTIAASGFKAKLESGGIAKEDATSNDVPTTTLASFTAINSAQTLASAALDTGMGKYGLSPVFELTIPASTYSGVYTSTVTVTIVTAPS